MADKIKRLFVKNRVELAENIVLDYAMWNRLRADEVLSVAQQEKIELNNTEAEQIGKLLDFLGKGPDEAVISFCKALRSTKQNHIVDGLLTPSGPTKTSPTSNLPGGALLFEESEVKEAKTRISSADSDERRDNSMEATIARSRKRKHATDAGDTVGVEFAADVRRARYAPGSSDRDDNDTIVAGDTGANSPKSFVEYLNENRVGIVKKLDDLDDIVEYLLWIELISKNEKQLIMAKDTDMHKVRALLDYVDRKGEEACRGLVVAMRDTDQLKLCTLSDSLKKELDKLPASDVLGIDKYMTGMKDGYKEQIKKKNKLEEEHYGNRVSLEQHDPVIINREQKLPDRQLRHRFDEFDIEKTDGNQLKLDDVFLPGKDGRPHSILMLGGPGMGKTSLCFNILNLFARGLWKGHQFIFFLLLKKLDDMAQFLSLADLLFDFGRIRVEESQKLNMIQQLEKRQDQIMFVLDGYDECDEFMRGELIVSDPSKKAKVGAVLRNLVQGNIFPRSQVLITSRPFRQVCFNVDRVVELAGLSKDAVNKLLGQFMGYEGQSGSKEFLNNHADVAHMLCIPINIQRFLSNIGWLHDQGHNILANLPKTKSALFLKQMLPVVKQCIRSIEIGIEVAWSHPAVKYFLLKLAKLAGSGFDNLGKKHVMFESRDLERCKLTDEEVKKGGLVTVFLKHSKGYDGTVLIPMYYFNHLTTLEWCGGLETASQDLKHIEGLIKRNNGTFDVILIFTIGFLGSEEGQEILEHIYDIPKHASQYKAHDMLTKITDSERCREPGGPQFALEAFFEGEFVNPRPLLSLLTPGGNVLEIEDIAQANRQAVGYFVEQMNSSRGEQTGAAGIPGSEIGLDTVRLHFTAAAEGTVQKRMVAEFCMMKNLKHLLIETKGHCEVVVERPLDMLLMHGHMTEDSAARVIETSRASTLCLYNNGGLCDLPGSTQLTRDTQEILLGLMYLHSDTLTSMVTTSLRAITGLWYKDVTAAAIRHVIEKTPALQALGLWLYTLDAAACRELSRVVSASRVACLSLMWVKPNVARHMEFIRDSLDNASSLRELWLEFLSPPSAAVLVDLARRVCRHGRLISLSLVGLYGDRINVTCFLKQLAKKPHSVRHIYTTDDVRSVERDEVSFTGELQEVRGDPEGVFYTPLVYSDYLLTSIPSHVRQVLTRRYVSPD